MAVAEDKNKSVSEQNAPQNPAEVAEVTTTTTTPPTTGEGTPVMGYDDQIKALQEMAAKYKPETEEERKKRERREKSKKIIAAVSDGVSALSNLYFTSQYAPHSYNHEKQSQLAATNAHIDKLKAARDADNDRYLNYALKIGDLKNQQAKTLREAEAQAENMRIAREKAQQAAEKHEWEKALQPDKQREQTGKANKAESDAVSAGIAAEYAQQMQEAKLNTEQERANAQRASAANSYASASAHGRSNVKEFSAWDEHGNEHKFKTKEAAENYAKQHGTWKETDEVTHVERDSELNGQSSQTTKKKGGYPQKPTNEDNTPPSRRKQNNDDNTPPSRR